MAPGATPLILHATAVAFQGRAALITGASGRGKSALALQLMACGADLVADDRTCLWRVDDTVLADAPDALRGRIEARFIGILHAQAVGPVALRLCIDLDTPETERLPPHRSTEILGIRLPLLHTAAQTHFPAAILQYLRAGRSE